ncbi:hypothetical protein BDD12DRAFT_505842 [Trichophaea hybrida]|nr:hypothetical protein BDD12DRAFT_505842 [Trichophaea hybrida]
MVLQCEKDIKRHYKLGSHKYSNKHPILVCLLICDCVTLKHRPIFKGKTLTLLLWARGARWSLPHHGCLVLCCCCQYSLWREWQRLVCERVCERVCCGGGGGCHSSPTPSHFLPNHQRCLCWILLRLTAHTLPCTLLYCSVLHCTALHSSLIRPSTTDYQPTNLLPYPSYIYSRRRCQFTSRSDILSPLPLLSHTIQYIPP